VKNWLLLSTVSVVCCGILALLPTARGQTEATAARVPRAALKIAVVDMVQLLQQYKKADALLDEAKTATEARNAKLQNLVGQGQELIKELKDSSFDPSSKEYRQQETKIFQIESLAKAFKSSAEKELQRENLKSLLEVYEEIQDVLKLFSEKNGLTVILRVDNEARTLTDPKAVGRVVGQDVIYHHHSRDITIPVVAYLNRRYQSSKANAGGDLPKATRTGEVRKDKGEK
jgi:Skp family chaperone for outer membrane proteins